MHLPVFIISLKEADKRRKKLMNHLSDIQFDRNLHILDGANGRDLGDEIYDFYDRKKRLRYFGRDLTSGELGCFLSHKKALEYFLANGARKGLILEDDARLRDDLPQIIKRLEPHSEKLEIVRFLGNQKVINSPHRKLVQLKDDSWLVRLKSIYGGAYAYLVTRKGARKMLDYLDSHKSAYPIDILYGRSWETGTDNLTVIGDNIANVDLSLESHIGNQRFNKQMNVAGFGILKFKIARGFYKLSENMNKRIYYYRKIISDRKFVKSH